MNRNENEIKQLLYAIKIRYEDRRKKIDEAQNYCDKNVKEIQKLYGVIQVAARNIEMPEQTLSLRCNQSVLCCV